MKLKLGKEWFEERISLEDDSDVAAGVPPSKETSDSSNDEEMSKANTSRT